MEKLTKEKALEKIEDIKSYNTRYLDEAPNEPECELYTNFVESIANGLYKSLEEIVEVAKILSSVNLDRGY
jgi:hypothetical protein